MREDPVHTRDVRAIVATIANAQERTFVVAWLAALLCRGALREPLRRHP